MEGHYHLDSWSLPKALIHTILWLPWKSLLDISQNLNPAGSMLILGDRSICIEPTQILQDLSAPRVCEQKSHTLSSAIPGGSTTAFLLHLSAWCDPKTLHFTNRDNSPQHRQSQNKKSQNKHKTLTSQKGDRTEITPRAVQQVSEEGLKPAPPALSKT